jgi:hypothetical protein
LSGARVWENGTKKKKHQAYFANKINIYEDKNSCEIRKKKIKTRKKMRDTSQNTSTHTHTDLRDENGREREKEKSERQESQ